MKHILIDYENIQPNDFSNIDTNSYHVWLFLGVHQQKSLPLPLVEFLLACKRSRVHIIKMQQAGKNALDFYLSFYLGRIVALEPNAIIEVLSRDSGYDVLVQHIKQDYPSINIIRTVKQALILSPEKSVQKSKTENKKAGKSKKVGKQSKVEKSTKKPPFKPLYNQAIMRINDQPSRNRPAKLTSLENFLRSQLSIDDINIIEKIITKMVDKQLITISVNHKITYN